MLPSFYQEILEKYLSNRQLITLKMLVWVLQTQKEVRIERLAANLPLPSMNECQELVLEMMALVPNKMPFYQPMLRAVILIQQPL